MYDVIIIGGGPAGTAAAISAARLGVRVLLLEQGRFPRHKVCGEFVSAESLALLKSLLQPHAALLESAHRIPVARIFLDGRILRARISPPAASISRFDLDLALWRAAVQAGVDARQQTLVRRIAGDNSFLVESGRATLAARSVINASGRWSSLTARLRSAPLQKWLGIKAHFQEGGPPCSVDLYFFPGGYCGVQPVGSDLINVSAMVRADIASTLPEVLARHGELRRRSVSWRAASEPVSTSPLFFCAPVPVRHQVLMAGDAAGFVDPFVGDGIALALRTGAAAAACLHPFWRGEVTLSDACLAYQQLYQQTFFPVFRNARRFRHLLSLPATVRAPFVRLLARTGLPRFVVRSTRGTTAEAQ